MKPLVHDLVRTFAKRNHYRVADLMGRSREPGLCRARHLIWKEAREGGRSLPEIGRIFGRHHTTIMSGVNRVRP